MSRSDTGNVRRPRTPRGDGIRSRQAILDEAGRLATVEGLEGLSIGRLADAVGMSKSGLYAHFGSKEELQLATVEAAGAVFSAQVVEPASGVPPGIARLRKLVDGYLSYLANETFPGGCFFAAALADVDTRPGRVRDRLVAFFDDWLSLLEKTVDEAKEEGAIDRRENAAQLAFEIEAALFLGNAQFVIARAPEPLDRARRAIERRLEAV